MVLGVAMMMVMVLVQLVMRVMVAGPMSVVVRNRLHLLFTVARRGHQLLRLDLGLELCGLGLRFRLLVVVVVPPVVDQGAMHTLLALVLAALVQLVVDRG